MRRRTYLSDLANYRQNLEDQWQGYLSSSTFAATELADLMEAHQISAPVEVITRRNGEVINGAYYGYQDLRPETIDQLSLSSGTTTFSEATVQTNGVNVDTLIRNTNFALPTNTITWVKPLRLLLEKGCQLPTSGDIIRAYRLQRSKGPQPIKSIPPV